MITAPVSACCSTLDGPWPAHHYQPTQTVGGLLLLT